MLVLRAALLRTTVFGREALGTFRTRAPHRRPHARTARCGVERRALRLYAALLGREALRAAEARARRRAHARTARRGVERRGVERRAPLRTVEARALGLELRRARVAATRGAVLFARIQLGATLVAPAGALRGAGQRGGQRDEHERDRDLHGVVRVGARRLLNRKIAPRSCAILKQLRNSGNFATPGPGAGFPRPGASGMRKIRARFLDASMGAAQ